MYKHLYNCYQHWYRGGQIYFYSDPHFSDEEMKYIRKNYIGDEEQIKYINSVVGKNDTLILLGDIGNRKCLKQLRGYKILVLGNHDCGAQTYHAYVDEVYEGIVTISNRIVISHEPIDLFFALNIHGHTHNLPYQYDNLHLNMCAEAINYTPVSLKSIINSGIMKDIPTIHRITIDEAIARKACV